MRVHLIPVLGSRKLADVAADRVSVEKLLKGLTAGVQRPAYTALSAMLTHARRNRYVGASDLHGIRLDERAARPDLYFANHGEMVKLAEGLGAELGPAVWIMRGTGVRPGECLALRKADFVNGHLRVQR